MMISDGAPVDDSTLSVNSGSYLERHLRQVIDEIETRSPVELRRHRHRPRRDALLSPRRDHHRRRGACRRHDRQARRAVRRGSRLAAIAPRGARARRAPSGASSISVRPVALQSLAHHRRGARRAAREPRHRSRPSPTSRRACYPTGRCLSRSPPFPSTSIASIPDAKQFGKLICRGGINLFANRSFFGGYSATGRSIPPATTLLAISDAGTWLRATLDYDGRELKGLSNAVLGPLLGRTASRSSTITIATPKA